MKATRISTVVLTLVLGVFASPFSLTATAALPINPKSAQSPVVAAVPVIAIPILIEAIPWDKFIAAVKEAFKSREVTAWKVVMDSLKAERKVLIGETTLNTEIVKWHEAWYGSITMKTKVKYRAKYASDLRDVKLAWDDTQNTVTIVLPETRVESVEQMEFVQDVSYSRVRILFAAHTREALANATRRQARTESKKEAEKHIAKIRAEGIAALQSALEEKLQHVKPGIKVIVE